MKSRCFHCGSKRRRLYTASIVHRGIPWRVVVCRQCASCPICDLQDCYVLLRKACE